MDLFTSGNGADREPSVRERIEADARLSGEPIDLEALCPGAIGYTMFDLVGSDDRTITVLLPEDKMARAPSQALMRVHSTDGLTYLAMVSAGPFALPDSFRGDASVLVASLSRGSRFKPPFHGRVMVTLLGQELGKGLLGPPRLRPLPHSPVVPLSNQESAEVLKVAGEIAIGKAYGLDDVVVGIRSHIKEVLPRHTAVLGTTGGGKSTTIAGLIQKAQADGISVVVLDVEGEYTRLHQPTSNDAMISLLEKRGMRPEGLPKDRMTVYHLVGRDTANPQHPDLRPFSLRFERLSPYAAIEILELTDPQEQRFLKAYDIAKEILRDLGVFPRKNSAADEQRAADIDEFDSGYPELTLPLLLDVVSACKSVAEKEGDETGAVKIRSPHLRGPNGIAVLKKRTSQKFDSAVSWRALHSRLSRLERLGVFDVGDAAPPIRYETLLEPGRVSVIDLSDSGMSELNSIVIADMLSGLQAQQDRNYVAYEQRRRSTGTAVAIPRTLVIIEEAHEFLSGDRIAKMRNLATQVSRIAKRGRKRWLGLVFVTQLPQHLPREILSLVNSFVLHKISDPNVISDLRKSISGIDESLWSRLPALSPGQAIVSFPHMTRPLLVSVDPCSGELRMTD